MSLSSKEQDGLTHHSKYIRIAPLALVAQWIEHLLAEQRAVCSNHTEGAFHKHDLEYSLESLGRLLRTQGFCFVCVHLIGLVPLLLG